MADYTFGVPWRPGNDWREKSWAHVRAHLEATGARCFYGDDNPRGPFSRAGTANHLADLVDDGVFILHDADMLAPLDAYRHMADLAAESGRLVIGYHQYRALDQPRTLAVIERGADPFRQRACGVTEGWSRGGIAAIHIDAWRKVGGIDPRFRAWGCEDWAFAHAASVVLGPFLRATNPAVHLWHPHAQGEQPELEAVNSRLLNAYAACETVEQLRTVQTSEVPA